MTDLAHGAVRLVPVKGSLSRVLCLDLHKSGKHAILKAIQIGNHIFRRPDRLS
jgi:hypothetical protein